MAPRPNRTTIVVRPDIRDGLKHIARKDQSYNELLADLIQLHQDHVRMIKSCSNLAPSSPTNDQTASSTVLVEGGPL